AGLRLGHGPPFCKIASVTAFESVVGHARTLARLADDAAADQLTHALLFTGPESVGKTTAAVALAGVLLDGAAWPGGVTAHPDLWLEDSDAENLSIQRVRAGGELGPTLQDFLALRTYAGGRRVGIIARAGRWRPGSRPAPGHRCRGARRRAGCARPVPGHRRHRNRRRPARRRRAGARGRRGGARAGAGHAGHLGVVRARRRLLRAGRPRAGGVVGLPPRPGAMG